MMTPFAYRDGQLHCEAVPLSAIAAAVGTPVYIYSQAEFMRRAEAYATAVSPTRSLICYAVKANGNPALLRLLHQAGLGADVTSGGELFLARHASIPAEKIIYSGVGKTAAEIETAVVSGLRAIHVESEMELWAIAAIATNLRRPVSIGVRVNPDINVETHPYISTGQHAHKFGVPRAAAFDLLRQAAADPWLEPVGLAAHIGSQITDLAPFVETAEFLVAAAAELAAQGIRLRYLDVGGGLGIPYEGQTTPTIQGWATAVTHPILEAGYEVVLEPGRSIVGPVGVLLTQVVYTKNQGEKHFTIADAGMNDLIRPTLYAAYHPVLPVNQPASNAETWPTTNLVGPICETGDFLARERPLPPSQPGDLLALLHAGAYGFAMGSNYNGRLRPAEVLVNDDQFHLIRRRQTLEHLLDGCG
jgi:diaminopimelate decarboxylase